MSDPAKFTPRLYYGRAWRLLRGDLLIFVVKMIASGLGSAVWLLSLGFIALIVLIHLGRALDLAPSILAMGEMLPRAATQAVSRPGLLPGAAGILLGSWALTVCIDALTMSAVWGLIARRIHEARAFAALAAPSDRPRRHPRARSAGALMGLASHHFVRALKLQLMSLVVRATLTALAVLLLIGVWSATTGHGALASAPAWARAIAWALPVTLWCALAILVRLTLALAAAPLMLERAGVGESLLEAAVVVSRRFVDLYRLFVFGAGLLLVPLLGYWLVLILSNFAADTPALMPVLAIARIFGDLLLAASIATLSVLFYAVLFLYFDGLNHGLLFVHGMTHDTPNARDATASGAARPLLPRPGTAMTRPNTLEDYLPREYPNIVAIDEITARPLPAPPADDALVEPSDDLFDELFDDTSDDIPGDLTDDSAGDLRDDSRDDSADDSADSEPNARPADLDSPDSDRDETP